MVFGIPNSLVVPAIGLGALALFIYSRGGLGRIGTDVGGYVGGGIADGLGNFGSSFLQGLGSNVPLNQFSSDISSFFANPFGALFGDTEDKRPSVNRLSSPAYAQGTRTTRVDLVGKNYGQGINLSDAAIRYYKNQGIQVVRS